HRNGEPGEILLVLEIAVDCQEHVEFAFSELQELAVSLAGPSHLGRGLRLVAGQLAFEPPREALVKQDAHGRAGPLWLAPTRRSPAPSRRWGSLRGIPIAARRLRGSRSRSGRAHAFPRTRECRS